MKTEDVLDARADVAFGDLVDGLENGDLFIEEGSLILCEVADLAVVAHLQLAFEVDLAHNGLDEG